MSQTVGRHATKRDKNGLAVPVRADRDVAIRYFFAIVPGQSLGEAMQMSGDRRFFRLYDALRDDAYRNTSPGTLCRKFGISWLDLMELWRQYNTACGLMRMATQLPQIMNDVIEDALSHETVCFRCDGMGTESRADKQRTCQVCKGCKKVRIPGHEHAQWLVLKALRLTQVKSPTAFFR